MADVDLLMACGCTQYAYLGQGQYGRVYIVVLDGKYLAAKIINNSAVALAEFNTSSMIKACRIENRFILGVHHCLRNAETDQHVLFLDYSDQGDLSNVIKENSTQGIPEPFAKRLLYMLISGLTDLHKHGFMHRDIKPDNLLLSYNPTTQKVRLVISDFGLLKRVSDGSTPMISTDHTICGTPLYMPPEAMLEQPYNHKIDVWASGCILYEMLTGEHPFQTESFVKLQRKIQAGPNLSHPPLDSLTNANPNLLDLLQKMFDPAILTRIDTLGNTLLSHPYFTKSTPTIGMDNVELGWDEFQFLKSGCVGYQPSLPQVSQTLPQTQPLPRLQESNHLRGTLVEDDPKLLMTTNHTQHQQPDIPKEVNKFAGKKKNLVPSTETAAQQDTDMSTEGRSCSPSQNPKDVGGNVPNERAEDSNSQPPSQVPQKSTRFGRKTGRVGEARDKVKMACVFCGVAVEIKKMEDHIRQMHQDEVQKKEEEEKRQTEEEQNRIKKREEKRKRKEEEERTRQEEQAQREKEEERRRKEEEDRKRAVEQIEIKKREKERKQKEEEERKRKEEQAQREKEEERRRKEEEDRKRAVEQIEIKKREKERKQKEEEERKRKEEQAQREKEEERKEEERRKNEEEERTRQEKHAQREKAEERRRRKEIEKERRNRDREKDASPNSPSKPPHQTRTRIEHPSTLHADQFPKQVTQLNQPDNRHTTNRTNMEKSPVTDVTVDSRNVPMSAPTSQVLCPLCPTKVEKDNFYFHVLTTCPQTFLSLTKGSHLEELTIAQKEAEHVEMVCPLCEENYLRKDFVTHYRQNHMAESIESDEHVVCRLSHRTELLRCVSPCPFCRLSIPLSDMFAHLCGCTSLAPTLYKSPNTSTAACPYCLKQVKTKDLLDHIDSVETSFHGMKGSSGENLRTKWNTMRQRLRTENLTDTPPHIHATPSVVPPPTRKLVNEDKRQSKIRMRETNQQLHPSTAALSHKCPFCDDNVVPDRFLFHLLFECKMNRLDSQSYPCPICHHNRSSPHDTFSTPQLINHIRVVHHHTLDTIRRNNPQFSKQCPFCRTILADNDSTHLSTKHPLNDPVRKQIFCMKCLEFTPTDQKLRQHLAAHHMGIFMELTGLCPFCSGLFQLKDMMDHFCECIQKEHMIPPNQPRRCPFCVDNYRSDQIIEHLETKERHVHEMKGNDGPSHQSKWKEMKGRLTKP
ncbi:putative cAMP-dependent protein kinase type 2 [Blattamonas nauphoetae]|uniref:non-specific serine/threonine protein kinase n=1 Tax=Blattamonas nauphoetae TaxID=2049346 RepID=A0ABQ9XU74_9EUKA|nr:putative cAMP-dependent protein kinase type 2 [Blattamonas nauphoetae]